MFTVSQIESFLNILKDPNIWIIVEGKRDKEVLSKLEVKNIFDISGKRLEDCVGTLISKNPESVVILTDFDKEGLKKHKQLSKLFASNGIKINYIIRKRFNALFKVQKVEELNSFIKLMEDDYNGKTCSVYDKIFNRSRILSRRNSRKT
jgi:5S rRNA maturation endonuclease (ribonuclease M5)